MNSLPKVSSEDFTPIFKRLFTLKRVKEAKLEKLCNEMNFIQAHADCAKLNFSLLPRLESMSVKKGFKQGW